MEVRDEGVDDAEAMARIDEEIGAAGTRANLAGVVGSPLEGAGRGGAHADDPPALGARAIDRLGRRRRNLSALGLEPMLFDRGRTDRPEGPGC